MLKLTQAGSVTDTRQAQQRLVACRSFRMCLSGAGRFIHTRSSLQSEPSFKEGCSCASQSFVVLLEANIAEGATDSRDACATGLDCQENKERNERHERGDLFSQASGGFEKNMQDHDDFCVWIADTSSISTSSGGLQSSSVEKEESTKKRLRAL